MEFLVPLALLACPVGMGLMMWFMARGTGGRKGKDQLGSIDDLRAEQAKLAAQIDRLERPVTPVESERVAEATR